MLYIERDVADPVALALEFFQVFEVLAKNRLGLDTVLQTPKLEVEGSVGFLGQTINHPLAVTLRGDHFMSPQVSEVLGNRHLVQAKNCLKMANAKRTVGKEMQNPQTRFVAEAFVNLDQLHTRQRIYPKWYIQGQKSSASES